jgi:HK97 family phage major capsid protein
MDAELEAAIAAVQDSMGAVKAAHAADLRKFEDNAAELERKVNMLQLNGTGLEAAGQAATQLAGMAGLLRNPRPEPIQASAEQRDAWARFLRRGDLRDLEAAGGGPEYRAQGSVGSDPGGGYLVPAFMSRAILMLEHDSSPVRQYARIETVPGDAFEEPSDRDVAESGWVGETAARADTAQGDLGLLRIPLHEIYAQPKTTQKLIDVATFNVGSWYQRKAAEALTLAEATAFISGNGVTRPRGLLVRDLATTADDTRPWGTVQYVPTGEAGGFNHAPGASPASSFFDIVEEVVGELKVGYRVGATWWTNRRTAAAVRKLRDTLGNSLWRTSVIAGDVDTLAGYPVVIAEDMPAVAGDSLSIAFGNMRRSYLVLGHSKGIQVLPDPFTDKPNVRFYTTHRVGGDLYNSEAMKLVKFSAA